MEKFGRSAGFRAKIKVVHSEAEGVNKKIDLTWTPDTFRNATVYFQKCFVDEEISSNFLSAWRWTVPVAQ